MNKDRIKDLMDKLWKRYEYASILHNSSSGMMFSVSGRGIEASQNKRFCEDGYVVKAYDKGLYVEYSFNDFDEESVLKHIEDLFRVKNTFSDNIGINEYSAIPDEECVLDSEYVFHNNPQEADADDIIGKLTEIREKSLKLDEQIFDCNVRSQYQVYSKYFLSPNRELKQKVLWMSAHVLMMAKRGEKVKSYYKAYSNKDGMAVLDKLENDLGTVAEATIALLDAKTITPGEYDCICTPDVTGMIVHEAFGHGVEMDMFVKDRALAREYMGKQVASELVTMHDGAKAADEVATYEFDDEGVLGQDTVIIKNGILMSGICDSQAALSLHVKPTGNGRRESYERKAYTRMTNTFFEGGKDSLEDMIASIEEGYLLEDATCGMEDPKNWGIQCMVNIARKIEHGKLTGEVFSPIVLSGYVPDLLKSISMMTPDTVLCGSGFCGKGYKEFVKVSDGGPYIKARVKLG